MTDPDILHGIDFGSQTLDEHRYILAYDVEAATSMEAIERAVVMLRRDVYLIALHKAEETTPGHWHVTLYVREDA